jgi:anti-sigma factor RsiW
MLGCAHVGRLLQRYLDDRLDPDAAAAVAAHLEMCRRCGMEASLYRELKASLRHLGAPPAATMDRLHAFADQLAASGEPGTGAHEVFPSRP